MKSLTAQAGRFLANLRFEHLPPAILPLVRDAFTDTVAVIMVGIDEPAVDIVRRTLLEPAGAREARSCLSAHFARAPDAALLGGAAAHALDFDDQSLSGHPSAVLVPAILAEGEALGCSGHELVTAFVAGYEVWCELWRRGRNYHAKGWHPTSVFGVMAVAAAGAVLRRLSAERAAAALAIAASHAGGLGANFPSMTKAYHAGMAARNGLVAVRLAVAGLSAGADVLESPQGFLNAFSADEAPDCESPAKLGAEWYLLKHRLQIKRYPTCYFMHRSFEATVKTLAGTGIQAADIERVEVRMGRGQTTVLVNHRPQNRYEAQFSGEFAIAAAVLLGRMGVSELNDTVVQRADMQAFYPKVKLVPLDEQDARDPVFSPTECVTITLRNDEVLESGPIRTIRGHAADPLTPEELWVKFAACTVKTHAEPAARELFDLLQAVDALPSVRALPTCTAVFND
jgi:2-methylcitrate dehydratase PrpD